MSFWPSLFIFCFFLVLSSAGPNDYFTEGDAKHIENLVNSHQNKDGSFNNLKDTYHAVHALTILRKQVPHKAAICKIAKEGLASSKIENVHYAAAISKALGCIEKAPSNTVVVSALEGNTLSDLVHAVGAISSLGKENFGLDDTEILPAVNALLELINEDDGTWFSEKGSEEGSLYNAGLALTALSQLVPYVQNVDELSSASEAIPVLLEKGEDNEDDTHLYFHHTDNSVNSVTATAYVAKGISDFLTATGEKVDIDGAAIEKLASFLLSQKYASSFEDADAVLVGLDAVNSAVFKRPLVLSLANSKIHTSKERGRENDVKVTVTDVFGKPVDNCKVFLIRVYQSTKETTPLLSNQAFTAMSDQPGSYSLDFLAARPDPGAYVLEFRVVPPSADYQPITTAIKHVQVIAQVKITDGNIAVSDSVRDPNVKGQSFSENTAISKKLELTSRQHLFVSFKLKNSVSGRSILAHQAFAKFTNKNTTHSYYFVIPQVSQGYQLHVDATKDAKKFNHQTGSYLLELIVGDPHIDKSSKWVVAELAVTFDGTPINVSDPLDYFKPLPPIEHQFRPSANLAPEYITNIFSLLVLAPLLFLIFGIFRAGGNLANYPTTGLIPIYSLLFLGGIGGLFGLIVIYWLRLKLFTALMYLTVLGAPTMFFGNQVLRHYADQRMSSSTLQSSRT